MTIDFSKSLNELEGVDWGPPLINSVTASQIHEARATSLESLRLDQLKTLVDHGLGCKYLLGIALDALTADPLVQAKFFPGDLLESVLKIKAGNWPPESVERMRLLLKTISDQFETLESETREIAATWAIPPDGMAESPAAQFRAWREACAMHIRCSNPGLAANRSPKKRRKSR